MTGQWPGIQGQDYSKCWGGGGQLINNSQEYRDSFTANAGSTGAAVQEDVHVERPLLFWGSIAVSARTTGTIVQYVVSEYMDSGREYRHS
jgi:hypothetical protein